MKLNHVNKINELNSIEAKELFAQCCGCNTWVEKMTSSRPFKNTEDMIYHSNEIWNSIENESRLEAFLHHPKIGNINSLREKYNATRSIAESEQSGVRSASEDTLDELAGLNDEYEKKFGYIFIVCATGKTADEMLSLLKERIKNSKESEIEIAMNEQNKITKLRLEKFL